jgi:Fe-S-cluster-containing dehydrogenase component
MTKGLLVNYEFCTGCHSCEVACKKYLDLKKSEFGIKICEVGPYKYVGPSDLSGKWEWTFTPMLTKACDMCADRVAKKKMPMCVQHCQAWCIQYGNIEDLVKKIDENGRYMVLTTPSRKAL